MRKLRFGRIFELGMFLGGKRRVRHDFRVRKVFSKEIKRQGFLNQETFSGGSQDLGKMLESGNIFGK